MTLWIASGCPNLGAYVYCRLRPSTVRLPVNRTSYQREDCNSLDWSQCRRSRWLFAVLFMADSGDSRHLIFDSCCFETATLGDLAQMWRIFTSSIHYVGSVILKLFALSVRLFFFPLVACFKGSCFKAVLDLCISALELENLILLVGDDDGHEYYDMAYMYSLWPTGSSRCSP